jgi:hypothetical protein
MKLAATLLIVAAACIAAVATANALRGPEPCEPSSDPLHELRFGPGQTECEAPQ